MSRKTPALNLKNMVKTYLDYQLDEDVFNTFWHMASIGFIPPKTWKAFSEKVDGWRMSPDLETVRDANRSDAVVAVRNQITRALELV